MLSTVNDLASNHLSICTSFKAFTLAEVLITLGIIGVVASITMPTLIANYKKQVYVENLKTFYSIFSQGLEKSKFDAGFDDLSSLGLSLSLPPDEWHNNATEWVKNYFQVVQIKKISKRADAINFYYLNRPIGGICDLSCFTDFSKNSLLFVLKNGMKVELLPESNFVYIVVDVNGNKAPNIMGRDVFLFMMNAKGVLMPYASLQYAGGNPNFHTYWKNDNQFCGLPNSSSLSGEIKGIGCAARIIENSWKMDY